MTFKWLWVCLGLKTYRSSALSSNWGSIHREWAELDFHWKLCSLSGSQSSENEESEGTLGTGTGKAKSMLKWGQRQQGRSTAFLRQETLKGFPPITTRSGLLMSAPELSFHGHESEAATQRKLTLEKHRPTTTSDAHLATRTTIWGPEVGLASASDMVREDGRNWNNPTYYSWSSAKSATSSLMIHSRTGSTDEHFHQHNKTQSKKEYVLDTA